jgi:hypothetical protein
MATIVLLHQNVRANLVHTTGWANDSHKLTPSELQVVLLTKLIKFLKVFARHGLVSGFFIVLPATPYYIGAVGKRYADRDTFSGVRMKHGKNTYYDRSTYLRRYW